MKDLKDMTWEELAAVALDNEGWRDEILRRIFKRVISIEEKIDRPLDETWKLLRRCAEHIDYHLPSKTDKRIEAQDLLKLIKDSLPATEGE